MAETKELNAIYCDVFPDYEGRRVTTSIKVGDGINKIEYALPVPIDEAQAKQFYNLEIGDLVAQGVKNIAYRVTGAVTKVKEAVNPADPNFLEDLAETLRKELFITPRVGGEAARVNKEKIQATNDLMKVFGVSSIEELMEKAKKMKAAKK